MRAYIKNRRTITFNLLRAVRQYSNMVWGSRNTEKKKKKKKKRTKIGRKVEIMNIRYHAIASIRNETSKSVGGITCSGRTFPFRFLAEYGRL